MRSVRMRAELDGRHVSGAERIIPHYELEKVVVELLKRPKRYDKIVITVERVESLEVIPKSLPIKSYDFANVSQAHEFVIKKLKDAGISEEITKKALKLLSEGPNPKGGNMRGAVLMDVKTGERLEPDQERGIRTTRIDWRNRNAVKEALKERGIKKVYLERLVDALAIATKNIHCGIIAEICWSDDPEYITGYIASKELGYVRIKPMKEENVPIGGRVYFVNRTDLQKLIECLERKVMLIEQLF
ncbi:MAG: 6-carboxyhexanoate--CoA ligase [Hydrogenobacter sp.]|uniref:6-carboxyhexanoate--CoA ligase n=1 Tax=Hydrogenobacter thermophilus TaxID=940 RepID=UPI0030FB2A72